MNEQERFEFEELKRQVEDLRFQLARKTGSGSADIKASIISPSSVGGTIAAGGISAANMFAAGVVDAAAIGAGAVAQSELKYEQAQIVITGTSTSGTATVVSGDIPIGYFLSAFTTPVASYVQLAVSGTTLTATLSTAPGAGNSITIQIILLKS